MNLLEGQSEWVDFIVHSAIMPVIETYQPFYGLYFEVADRTGSITVNGEDLFAESEFALVKYRKNINWTGIALEERRDVIFPDHVVVSRNQAQLIFNRNSLKWGSYEIFVRNPGGLWTTFGRVKVGYRKAVDFTFSFGYSPMLAAFDYENAYDVEIINGTPVERQRLDFFNPWGYYYRLGFIPFKNRIGNFGLEVQVHYVVDKIDAEENVQFMAPFSGVSFNLLYQRPVTERLLHNARIGAGFGESYDILRSDNIPLLNFGYAAQFFIWKNLYLEGGIDLQYAFYQKLNINHFMIRPSISLGWQVGRWAEHAEVAEAAKRGEDYSVPVRGRLRAEHLLSQGWSPMILLFGIDPYDDNGNQLLGTFNPGGLGLRYVYLPHHWGRNKLGFGIESDFLFHPQGENYVFFSHVLFGVYYQRMLSERWQIGAHTGAGVSNPYDFEFNSFYILYAMNIGTSVQYFFWKNIYVEAGLDMVFIFPDPTKAVLRPSINVGWQINRNTETGLRLPGTGLPRFRSSRP